MREHYVRKFRTLTHGVVDEAETERFLAHVQKLPRLLPEDLIGLNVRLPHGALASGSPGIF